MRVSSEGKRVIYKKRGEVWGGGNGGEYVVWRGNGEGLEGCYGEKGDESTRNCLCVGYV